MNKKFRNAGRSIALLIRRTPGENIADLGGVVMGGGALSPPSIFSIAHGGQDWSGNPRFWSHRPHAAPQPVNCVSWQQPHFET
jgi:hypothetical protein